MKQVVVSQTGLGNGVLLEMGIRCGSHVLNAKISSWKGHGLRLYRLSLYGSEAGVGGGGGSNEIIYSS